MTKKYILRNRLSILRQNQKITELKAQLEKVNQLEVALKALEVKVEKTNVGESIIAEE